MQHYFFQSGHDIDLRSNFQNDILRSSCSSFDASREEKHDAAKINVVLLRSKND